MAQVSSKRQVTAATCPWPLVLSLDLASHASLPNVCPADKATVNKQSTVSRSMHALRPSPHSRQPRDPSTSPPSFLAVFPRTWHLAAAAWDADPPPAVRELRGGAIAIILQDSPFLGGSFVADRRAW